MKHSKTLTFINMIKIAKLIFFKVLPLSVTTLFATSAFAGVNCPQYNVINNYIKNGAFVADAPNTDWKLRATGSVNDFAGALPVLKSITAKRVNTTDESDVRIKSISCEYSDDIRHAQGKSIFLEMTTNGKILVDSYILNSITLNNDWNGGWELPKTAPFDAYICKSSALTNQCGGFEVKDHLEGQQRNAYWADAWKWCWRTWPGCYYKDPNSYTSRMMATETQVVEKAVQVYCQIPSFGYCYEFIKIGKPYCDEPTCAKEIATMNTIVAGTLGGDQGMAKYLKMSWAGTDWVNKVPSPSDMNKPTGSWPDYSVLLPTQY